MLGCESEEKAEKQNQSWIVHKRMRQKWYNKWKTKVKKKIDARVYMKTTGK